MRRPSVRCRWRRRPSGRSRRSSMQQLEEIVGERGEKEEQEAVGEGKRRKRKENRGRGGGKEEEEGRN
jgi:hypothetical protein